MSFYKEAYPVMFAALKTAKEKGHVITKAERFLNRYTHEPIWVGRCDVCGWKVWAERDEISQKIVAGGQNGPLGRTCQALMESKQRKRQRLQAERNNVNRL